MRHDLIRALARRLGADADTPDADLVRRFAAGRCDAAFAELVRRHGPMVWGVCRHLLPHSDAEDAFQAVFLALARSAGGVRDPAAVGGWLHGTAARVCLTVRRSAARRKARERAAAGPEAVPSPVPEAAWDSLLAAVHEEVRRLPEALRAAVVLCDLEGVAPEAAAGRLGWKPGTLSGRLARGRQRLLAGLARRGVAPAAAGLGVSCLTIPAPAHLAEAVLRFTDAAGAVPAAVLSLANGVTAMSRTKLIAAAVLLAGGLAAGVGGRLLAPAGAQTPQIVKETEDRLAALRAKSGKPAPAPVWEFKFFTPSQAGVNQEALASYTKLIDTVANGFAPDGWELCALTHGSEELKDDPRVECDDPAWWKKVQAGLGPQSRVLLFVFKRPTMKPKADAADPAVMKSDRLLLSRLTENPEAARTGLTWLGRSQLKSADAPANLDQLRALEAEIADKQKQLADLRAAAKKTVVFTAKELPGVDLGRLMTALVEMADVRYGGEERHRRLSFTHGKVGPDNKTDGLVVQGDPDAVAWVAELAGKLKPAK